MNPFHKLDVQGFEGMTSWRYKVQASMDPKKYFYLLILLKKLVKLHTSNPELDIADPLWSRPPDKH